VKRGPLLTAAALLVVIGCAAGPPPRSDNATCAALFDGLDAIDFLPAPVVGFDFRQMQLARLRQARCLTFSADIAGLEAIVVPAGPAAAGPVLRPRVAVQAGVVTNMEDDARARAFFERLGYRARSVGAPGLGRRIYVEATTQGEIGEIVGIAGQAGFVGAYPSRFVIF
jgi:hypothetical protein